MKEIKILGSLFIVLIIISVPYHRLWAAPQVITNGVPWYDTSESRILAHGAGVLKVGNYYYLFGENRTTDNKFNAVSCYRSTDLKSWEFRNNVLTRYSAAELNSSNVERPKVVYNSSTGKYVMWMHWENGVNYGEARAAVAISNTVDGNYTYLGSFRPYQDSVIGYDGKPGYMSRDCTLFVDNDGTAYFISAARENADLHIYCLTSDYTAIDELVKVLWAGQKREAPGMFKRNGYYFLITSGCTGWDPNQQKYAYATSITGTWSSLYNLGNSTTYDSQNTYELIVQGSSTISYLYLGDRWAGDWEGDVNDSLYVWLPLIFLSNTSISMSWSEQISIDTATGIIQPYSANWTKVDDTHSSIGYSSGWGTWTGNPGYQGTEHYSENTGSTATFTFNGTQARYYGFRRNDLGRAEIRVDGVLRDTIDCYADAGQYNVLLYETPTLSSGTHTLQVRVAGTKNVDSSGTEIIVDAFALLSSSSSPTPTIYAVSSEPQAENPAANILDGDPADTSRWSANGFPQWVIIDYGENKSITGTQVWTYRDRAYRYTVEMSTSPMSGYSVVVDRSQNTSGSQPISDTFAPVIARYVRITVTGAYWYLGSWVSLTEFAIVTGGTSALSTEGLQSSEAEWPLPLSMEEEAPIGSVDLTFTVPANTLEETTNVPEPMTLTLFSIGLIGLLSLSRWWRKRR